MDKKELFLGRKILPKPLTKEETKELIKEINNGSKIARDKLIIHNINLVIYVVNNNLKLVGCDSKELVSVGIIGLVKAVDTFDSAKDILFSTYACNCIKNEIIWFLSRENKIKITKNLNEIVKNQNECNIESNYEDLEMKKFIVKLVDQLKDRDKEFVKLYFGFYDRPYTQYEIAKMYNLSKSTVSKAMVRILDKLRMEIKKRKFYIEEFEYIKEKVK